MSNTNIDPEDEALFREVDEEMRQERLKELWDKFGVYVIAGAVALVAIVGGNRYWTWQSEQTAARSGDSLLQANQLMSDKKGKEATALYQSLTKGSTTGYQAIANLRLGALEASKGNADNALVSYKRVSDSASVDPIFREFATVQAAMLQVDTLPADKIRAQLKSIAEGKSAWRFMALEIIALAEYKAKNHKAALDIYARLRRETGVSASMRQRAEQMQSMLATQIEAPEAPEPAKKGAKVGTAQPEAGKNAAKDKK